MSKEQARQAVLSEYDSWVKKHPDDASMMGGFLFFRYLQTDKSDLLFSAQLAASGQSFTAGFEIRLKRLAERPLANLCDDFRTGPLFANRLSPGVPSTSLAALGYLDFRKACLPGPVADILIPGPISGSGGASLRIRMPTTRVNQKLSRLIPFSVAQQFLAQRI